LILDAANVTNIVMEPYAENANPMELTNPNFIKKTMADLMASTDKTQTHEDLVQGVMARVRYGYNGIVLFGDMFFNNRYQLDSKELVDLFKKALMDIVNPPEEEPIQTNNDPVEEPTEENHVHCRWSYEEPESETINAEDLDNSED
jgi:hypothetical protein